MRRLVLVLLAGVLVFAAVAPALAWEFDLKGVYEWRIRYYGRMGEDDLFGKANYQDGAAGTFVGFAGPNIYGTGNRAPVIADSAGGLTMNTHHNPAMVITRGGFSRWGSDALYNDMRMSFVPTIRINPAIRLAGVYNIGGMRNKYRQTGVNEFGDGVGTAPLERYYMAQTSMNATDGTFGVWEQFDMVAQLPWGIIVAGFRDFPFGTGATFSTTTRAEALLAVVPYGPFRFLWALFPGFAGYNTSWGTIPDGASKTDFMQAAAITYDQGCFHFGALFLLRLDHFTRGTYPGGTILQPSYTPTYGETTLDFNPGAADSLNLAAYNRQTIVGEVHAKYFNGRFFANLEYAWVEAPHIYVETGSGLGGGAFPAGGYAPIYIEGYHWFSEAGVVAGPSKVSLLYAIASGAVLNNGWGPPFGPPGSPVLNGGFAGLPVKLYCPFAIQAQAMEPYEYLMFNTYAGGNGGGWTGPIGYGNSLDLNFMSDEHGRMTDAYCFAGRFDYAVASNLNIWASYIWAHRLERAGFYNGGIRDTGDGAAGGVDPGTFLTAYGGLTPYCPDGYLGYEVGAGVDWKLLEGLNLKLRYAYWQPGDWFDYAYQALVPGGPYGNGESPAQVGILKTHSPINAFEGKMVVEF